MIIMTEDWENMLAFAAELIKHGKSQLV